MPLKLRVFVNFLFCRVETPCLLSFGSNRERASLEMSYSRMLLNSYSTKSTGPERIYNTHRNSTHADNHLYRMQKLVRMALWSESICYYGSRP